MRVGPTRSRNSLSQAQAPVARSRRATTAKRLDPVRNRRTISFYAFILLLLLLLWLVT